MALKRTEVVFDFITKLGVEYYCFHDRDVSPEGSDVSETNSNLWAVAEKLKSLQKATDVKLLWGTANMFSHPRFSQGASTSPNADVFAYCANSVKEMLDVSKFLGGENYVFWGGREGYNTLLNTNMGREADHAGRFFQMAVDYAKKIGFKGQFLIEPKACEPTKHQYDFDSATVWINISNSTSNRTTRPLLVTISAMNWRFVMPIKRSVRSIRIVATS
jgi:xylose isomerase